MVMARNIHPPLVTLALIGATLLALRPAWAQTVADTNAVNTVKNRPTGTISDSTLKVVADWMDEGRAALRRNDFRQAIPAFRKVVACVENQYSAEAQELLGLALQKSGQLAEAQGVYEDYLSRYPSSEARERVTQRLAAIVAAQDNATVPPRASANLPIKLPSNDRWASARGMTQSLMDSDSSPIRATNVIQNRRVAAISDSDLRIAAASMDEGRAALRRGSFRDAVALFAKVLSFPENPYSAEAEELLGFARQKNGQLAEARIAYENYLRHYPNGEASERVRQRLAGLVTAQDDKTAALRDPLQGPVKALPIGKFTKSNETTWSLTGSVSSFYIHDSAYTTARDTSLAPNLANSNADDHSVHQNEIFTTVDLLATWNDDHTSGKIRFNGGEEHRFSSNIMAPTGDQVDQFGVSQASLDMVMKDINLRTVLGRQTYNGDGVFGRFDGALFSWQALPMLKVDLVGGSPANSRYNLPFTNERWFYGGGIGIGPMFGGLETSIYFNEERGRWLVDREAIGSDIKYSDPTKFMFANIDYDVRFQQLGEAVVSGSWTLPEGSTLYGGADYRRVPFLSSWNALLNQPFGNLYDFLKAQNNIGQGLTAEQVNQLALAETPLYKSVMLGFSHPLSDKLTVSADATFANLSRTITPLSSLDPTLAQLATGNEYYATAQLIWTNIFKQGDMYTTAFHYAQQETDRQYVFDFNARYPVTTDLMLSPRLRLGYSQYTSGAFLNPTMMATTNITQYTVMPSVLIDYNITPNLQFETEIGTQWTYSTQPGMRTSDTEIFGTIGFRYTFDLDASKVFDRSKPASPAAAAICRYTVRPDGTCTTPSGRTSSY
jgi:outer membrane protein assembly factor BamD (BamD/ComL family)